MKKILPVFVFICMSCILAPGVVRGQQEDHAHDINLEKAQEIAREYLSLLKAGHYEKALDMVHTPNYNPENRSTDLEATRLFVEEFGGIIDYEFKDLQWHKPLFRYHWDPDKNPLTDEPDKIEEPPYVSLIYEIRYGTAVGEKDIQVVNDEGVLKIQKAGDKFTSPQAMLKLMNLINKLPRKEKEGM